MRNKEVLTTSTMADHGGDEMGFDFEKLDVYQKAVNFADDIYNTTSNFPKVELFGTVSQLRRAALSVSLNIAEGTGRYHAKERRLFYRNAKASVHECVPILNISLRQKYITEFEQKQLYTKCVELARMISGLINSLPTPD